MTKLKRRTFIITGIAAVSGAAIGSFYLLRGNETKWKKQPLIYPLVLSNFLNEASLRSVGKSYLSAHPEDNSGIKLSNEITKDISSYSSKPGDETEMAQAIEKQVEMEFKSGRLLNLQGWVMSETEARQCALLSLS